MSVNNLDGNEHVQRIIQWFQSKVEPKYLKGQKEHGGNLVEKTGMLTHAIEEVLDLAVYLETMEEQLKRDYPEAYRFVCPMDYHETPQKDIQPKRSMPRVYIAGPFRGPDAWTIEQNIRQAEIDALNIWRMGGAAFCPHANTRFFQGTLPDSTWLDGDLEWVAVSDAMFLLRNWQTSQGAIAEALIAKHLAIPTFDSLSGLEKWIQEWKRDNVKNDTPS